MVAHECIYTYIDAANYPLNLYATYNVFMEAATEIQLVNNYSTQSTVQFTDALNCMALRCGDALSK